VVLERALRNGKHPAHIPFGALWVSCCRVFTSIDSASRLAVLSLPALRAPGPVLDAALDGPTGEREESEASQSNRYAVE
jgi:hypothetical protein